MRYLVVMLMCCLPVLAEAKEIDEYLWTDHSNGMVVTCNDTLTECWTPCELKMKEAMKAVDGYLPNREVLTGSTLEYCDDVCAAERALDAAKKQAVAMAKWRAVYKECVK